MLVRRRRHYGFTSFAYIGLTCLLAIGAVNSQNNLLFFAFGLSLAALLVSGIVSGTTLMRVRVSREPVGVGQVGEPLRVRYELTNTSRALPAFALTVRERESPRAAPREGAGRNARRAPTWPAHMPEARAFAAHIPPRASVHTEAVVRPTRRGVASFHALRVESAFPFGILRKSAAFVPDPRDATMTALIRPRALPVSASLFREASRDAADGDSTSRSVGRADEFFGLRDYAPGDTLRQIAWRASARLGDLVVRENVSHAPTRVWVAIVPLEPGEGGADADDLTERAVSLAAGVIEEAGRRSVDVGLFVLGAGAEPTVEIPPRAGPAHIGLLLDALAVLDLAPIGAGDRSRALPPGSLKAAWIVVHAGAARAGVGPPGAARLSALRDAPAPQPVGAAS